MDKALSPAHEERCTTKECGSLDMVRGDTCAGPQEGLKKIPTRKRHKLVNPKLLVLRRQSEPQATVEVLTSFPFPAGYRKFINAKKATESHSVARSGRRVQHYLNNHISRGLYKKYEYTSDRSLIIGERT